MKGKGEVLTYWLTGATEGAVQCREVRETDQVPQFTGVLSCHILVGKHSFRRPFIFKRVHIPIRYNLYKKVLTGNSTHYLDSGINCCHNGSF